MDLALRVLAFVGLLWLVALCLIGFLFGFAALLALVAFVVALCLLWRELPARERGPRLVYVGATAYRIVA